MAVDYLDSLKKFREGGGTDIGQFLDQHTMPTQTTPGPSVTAPSPVPTPQPSVPQPVQAAVGANPVNQVRAAFQGATATAAPTGGGVSGLPRNPITSRNLYPPVADQGRILGTSPAPMPIVQPATGVQPRPPAPAMPLYPQPNQQGRILGATQPAPNPVVQPADKPDPYRFRLPSEKASGRDFLTGNHIAANTEPESDLPPGAAPYSAGPLANPKPTPPSKPSGGRMAGAVAALPRNRNQRKMDVAPSKLYAA